MALTGGERQARMAAYETWENSPEGVHYNLSSPGQLAINNPQMERMIILAVAALPANVKKHVYKKCIFATVGAGVYGQVLPPTRNRWLILLDAHMIQQLDESEILGIIAHEIAHMWLRHDVTDPTLTIKCEREAANQAASWGFTGIGADPELHSQEMEGI